MAVLNANKNINKSKLKFNETAVVSISFEALPNSEDVDIVLMIDKSSSIKNKKLLEQSIIDLIEKNNNKFGIVTFSENARSYNLTNNKEILKFIVNNIKYGGRTNHEAAFKNVKEIFNYQTNNKKILIMYTDGKTTLGQDPNYLVEELKNSGVEIYCVLFGNEKSQISKWISNPNKDHISFINNKESIEIMYNNILKISNGAENVLLIEKVNKEFKINKIIESNLGKSEIIDNNTIKWEISSLGKINREKAILNFEIKCTNNENKITDLNESLIYKDKNNNNLTFPNPKVNIINNSTVIIPDSANNYTLFNIESCKDYKNILTNTIIQDLGRIVQVDVKLENVCPNRNIGLGIILLEVIDEMEFNRGIKTFLINSKNDACEDIIVKNIEFVIPESLGNNKTICKNKKFKVKILANYIDSDYIKLEDKFIDLGNA